MLSSRNEDGKLMSGRWERDRNIAALNYPNLAPWEIAYYDIDLDFCRRHDPDHYDAPTCPTDWMTPEKVRDFRKNNPQLGGEKEAH
jgi:hypothetical protein